MRRSTIVTAALLALLAACDVATDPVDDDAPLDEIEASTDGAPLTASIPANGWRTHDVSITQTSDLVAVLDWTSSVNLNLFLYDPAGTLVDYSNGTATRPEEVSRDSAAPGTWKLGIKNKSSVSATYTLSVTATPKTAPKYPAQPRAGRLFWGAAISGNGDPVTRHEDPSGYVLSIHRTYFQWDQRTGSMINMARDDHAHGRLPWVSIKPRSWAAMASGQYDSEIDAMLRALQGLGKPVWLTVHHEPEGGGGVNAPDDPAGPAGHRAMNKHIRQRMTALGVKNVALAPILMSWTWTSASGRNPDEWWEPGIYDFLGVDTYSNSESTLLTSNWYKVRAWAAARGVDVAVGEWGLRGTDTLAGQLVRAWYDGAASSYNDGRGARVVGLCAFDSNLNSPDGGWELMGAQLTVFRQLLGDPRTAHIGDL
jgi:hypothetical protein